MRRCAMNLSVFNGDLLPGDIIVDCDANLCIVIERQQVNVNPLPPVVRIDVVSPLVDRRLIFLASNMKSRVYRST